MSDLTLTPPRAVRFGPEHTPPSVASALERLDMLNIEIVSIDGNIARLGSMMEDETLRDDEYTTSAKQRVHALTAKRYCAVELEWLKAWLRVNDPDSPPRMLRGILMELVNIKSLLARR